MYNPYQLNPFQQFAPQPTMQSVLPPQQIIQVNGKSSVDSIRMSPNSSLLVMDTSAPIVWMCISDGVGKVTATAYDITQHEDEDITNSSQIEKRLTAVETAIAEIGGRLNGNKQPDDEDAKRKSNKQGLSPD